VERGWNEIQRTYSYLTLWAWRSLCIWRERLCYGISWARSRTSRFRRGHACRWCRPMSRRLRPQACLPQAPLSWKPNWTKIKTHQVPMTIAPNLIKASHVYLISDSTLPQGSSTNRVKIGLFEPPWHFITPFSIPNVYGSWRNRGPSPPKSVT